MKKKYQIKKSMSDINVTPFVDVMLVLLIIFMVTAPLLTAGIKINLPESSSILKNEKSKPITVSIDKNNDIYLQKKKVTKNQLIIKLTELKKNNQNLKIFLKGDKNLSYGEIMNLMSLMNKSGFKKVALVTRLK